MLPGPHSYQNNDEISKNGYLAKSMLGGSPDEKAAIDNGFPGPGAYNKVSPLHTVPGIVMINKRMSRKFVNAKDEEERLLMLDVGPHSYSPNKPSWSRTDFLKKYTIGNSVR